MTRFALGRAARLDLKEIGRFSRAHFGLEVAKDYLRGFAIEFARLAQYPESAPLRPDFGDNVRCKVYRSHRILYQTTGAGIRVVRILHHAQSVPDKF